MCFTLYSSCNIDTDCLRLIFCASLWKFRSVFWNSAGAILEIGLRVGVIPLNMTSRHVLLINFLIFYSWRVQKPLQRTLPAIFCTKLRLINCVRLVWRHKTTNCQQLLFVQVKGWYRDHRNLKLEWPLLIRMWK